MKCNNSHSKLTLKKILTIIGILIGMFVIGVIFYYAGMLTWILIKTPDNYSIENMKKWEPLEVRMNYFKEHEVSFRNIASIMEKYPDIVSIKLSWKNSCFDNEVKASNTVFCVKKDSKLVDEISGINIDEEIESLSEIIIIEKSNDYLSESDEIEYSTLSFYAVWSPNHGGVFYNYCLNSKKCNSDDKYFENEHGKNEQKHIDDRWSNIYYE